MSRTLENFLAWSPRYRRGAENFLRARASAGEDRAFLRIQVPSVILMVSSGRFYGKKGFTFLELLIAITVFSAAAVAIYSSFGVGIRAWRKTEASYKARQETRHAFDSIGRNLRCAVKFQLKDPQSAKIDSFSGSSNEVVFWATLKAGVFRTKYIFDSDTKALYYISQSYKEAIEKNEELKSLLVPGVSGFKLEYAYKDSDENIVWGEDWKGQEEKIPLGVKIVLAYPSKSEEASIEYQEEVFIPTGTVEKKVVGP